ncbi:hypothetical protein [Bradymonas sediminis]|uniref:Uncharacterized protein n=1 Tax=Bradymonas sediminis TaxID=1548548 RepID=A0A2Z4FNS4_9DELT|nr:hypothetical protein [Bradymonas sediminis]AWV90532.1 hypothetical protein DN745_14825 [Bradymonas sediminis]TDP72075.1 hypothetical protein DFR33_10755 [Bradymonas sediminis]
MTLNTLRPTDDPGLRALAEDTEKMLQRIDALCEALQKEVRGARGVEAANRTLYADDASNSRAIPIGVILADDDTEIMRAIGLIGTHSRGVMLVEASVRRPGATPARGERLGEERVARDAAAEPKTYFRFPDDNGVFSQATLRCVNAGKSRADRLLSCPMDSGSNEEPARL